MTNTISNGFTLFWRKQGVGFGNAVFYVNKDTGQILCDNEYMSKEFIKEMLCEMIDGAIFTETSFLNFSQKQ